MLFLFMWAPYDWCDGQCNHAVTCTGVTTQNKEQLILTPAFVVVETEEAESFIKKITSFNFFKVTKLV